MATRFWSPERLKTKVRPRIVTLFANPLSKDMGVSQERPAESLNLFCCLHRHPYNHSLCLKIRVPQSSLIIRQNHELFRSWILSGSRKLSVSIHPHLSNLPRACVILSVFLVENGVLRVHPQVNQIAR